MDQVLSQEDQEIEALVSLMEAESERPPAHLQPPTDYGSDDEDYDDICMEALNEFDAHGHAHVTRSYTEEDQEMDVTKG